MDDDSPIEISSQPFSIASFLTIPTPVESKFKYEFQQLGTELAPTYGKGIWSLFYKPGFTEHKIRTAHEICVKKGIIKIGYLIGIVKKLPL